MRGNSRFYNEKLSRSPLWSYTRKKGQRLQSCLRIAIERRTWSQNDALVMKNQLKEPIFTLFVFFAIVQIVFCMENINYLLSKSKISLLDCNNNRQPCP